MWLKKKSQISGFNSNTATYGGDWRITGNLNSWSVYQDLPSIADAGKYFYLPALGVYRSGQLYDVGEGCHYWSSSAHPQSSYSAYYLFFYHYNIGVHYFYNSRDNGYRVEPTFE